MPRQLNQRTLEALKPVLQHRTVSLLEDVGPDFNDVVRPDAKDVRVERRVVEAAQGHAMGDDGLAARVGVRQNVSCIEQLSMPQATDSAVLVIRL